MKIAIVSDLHIGYERFAEDAFRQAKEALEAASAMADAIIIPGDIFDKRAPKPDAIAEALNIFRELSRKNWAASAEVRGSGTAFTNVPILAIPGTHERTSAGRENALKLLALAGMLIDISESTAVISNGSEHVAVFGLGGISDERVKEKLKELDPKPVEGIYSIFMFHQSVYELLPFNADFIKYEDLPVGFDLYVDGHIHNTLEAKVHGKPFLIPGSTVLTQMKDAEQGSKGFILFDTKDSSHKFIHINSRKFFSIRLEFKDSDTQHILEKCENEVKQVIAKSASKPIIKVHLEGTLQAGLQFGSLNLKPIISKYGKDAFIEIDQSKLTIPELAKSIEGIHENKIGDLAIKDLGASFMNARLKELAFDNAIDVHGLFELLDESSQSKKQKTVDAALKFLNAL
ncbi:MAG: metallophosphoesterase [Candidatus Marsarchaeota archaeon]|nr:metallophosphoesterase [Candidatus Marsarchaeota archaeon]